MTPLPRALLESVARAALQEDWGRRGDITSLSLLPPSLTATAHITTNAQGTLTEGNLTEGTLAGVDVMALVFTLTDPTLKISLHAASGETIKAGDKIATVQGRAISILAAERVALNFLGHLSGIATTTQKFVKAVAHTSARICCTRKTIPGLRLLEKEAVQAGGGVNHRFGLDDGILIKDNHIALIGSVGEAVKRARKSVGHMVKIAVEVETCNQLQEAVREKADVILLDNMTVAQIREAVSLCGGRAVLEASGGVTLKTAPSIAETGVDFISIGALTQSAPALDVTCHVRSDATDS